MAATDAGGTDAGARLDAGAVDAFVVIGTDAPLPDVFVPMGVDAGELPDVFVELPDAFVLPDACTPSTFYVDGDGDGHGDGTMTVSGCTMPMGAAAIGDDCNDAAMAVHPGATEACDGVDQDCDMRLDEGSGPITSFYPDGDGDGHGVIGGSAVTACAAPPGRAALADDCNDAAPTVYAGAAEVCNAIDEDCDGASDESLQRLLRAPHEIVPLGGVDYDFAHAAAIGGGYVLVYQTPSIFVRRVGPDGSSLGSPRIVSADGYAATVLAVSDTNAVVVFSRNVSGTTYSVHAVEVDFTVEPASVATAREVGRGVNALGPSAAFLEGRVVVAYTSGASTVARTYAPDLSDPSAPVTLFSFSSNPHLLRGDGASWVMYEGFRPGTTDDECYAQRLVVSPLGIDPTVVTLGDGSGECEPLPAAAPNGHAYAVLSYSDGARFELMRATLAPTLSVTRRTTLSVAGPFAFALPGMGASSAGADFLYATSPGSPRTLAQFRHVDPNGAAPPPSSFGGAEYIAGFSVARTSSRHGAVVYVATPTGGSTHALWMQEIGCE